MAWCQILLSPSFVPGIDSTSLSVPLQRCTTLHMLSLACLACSYCLASCSWLLLNSGHHPLATEPRTTTCICPNAARESSHQPIITKLFVSKELSFPEGGLTWNNMPSGLPIRLIHHMTRVSLGRWHSTDIYGSAVKISSAAQLTTST